MPIGVFWMVEVNLSAVTVISSRPELSSEAAVVAAQAHWVPQRSNAKLAITRSVVTRRMTDAFIPESPFVVLCAMACKERTRPACGVRIRPALVERCSHATGARDEF